MTPVSKTCSWCGAPAGDKQVTIVESTSAKPAGVKAPACPDHFERMTKRRDEYEAAKKKRRQEEKMMPKSHRRRTKRYL